MGVGTGFDGWFGSHSPFSVTFLYVAGLDDCSFLPPFPEEVRIVGMLQNGGEVGDKYLSVCVFFTPKRDREDGFLTQEGLVYVVAVS